MHRRLTVRLVGVMIVALLTLLAATVVHGYLTRWEPPLTGREAFRSTSPEGTWELIVFDVLSGGATVSGFVRVDIRATATGNQRLLYYAPPFGADDEDAIGWESDDVAVIMGRRLSAVDGRYDFRYDGPRWERWGVIGGVSLAVAVVGLALVFGFTAAPRRRLPGSASQ